jgi:hypothetical protein
MAVTHGHDHAFVVVADRVAEQPAEHVVIDDNNGQDRGREGQGVEPEPKDERGNGANVLGNLQVLKQLPALVVDRRRSSAVVLRLSQELLRVFANDVLPQVEVVAPVPQGDARRLELPRKLGRISPVQQE